MKRIIPTTCLFLVLLASCASDSNFYRNRGRNGWFYHASDRIKIVTTAKRLLGVRYRRGGASPSGFDCSGYVMYVYGRHGVQVPRTVKGQFYAGKRINFHEAGPGDLVFYKTLGNRYSHVGIYLGNNQFVHAPRSGKKVSFADMDTPYWKKRYIGAVTFVRGN